MSRFSRLSKYITYPIVFYIIFYHILKSHFKNSLFLLYLRLPLYIFYFICLFLLLLGFFIYKRSENKINMMKEEAEYYEYLIKTKEGLYKKGFYTEKNIN